MGVLCSVVESFVLPMLNALQDLSFCCPIPREFIRDDHPWNRLKSLEQFAEKSLGRLCVASALDQDIEHIAILIHRSPEGVLLATNGEKHLVHMPLVAIMRAMTASFVGLGLPKLQTLLSNRFIGYNDPTPCQKLFDRTES